MSERPAFYALAPGGWRDYWTLLHLPYTDLAPVVRGDGGRARRRSSTGAGCSGRCSRSSPRSVWRAHALDELRGRPLGTSIPSWVLVAIAVVGLGGAFVIGTGSRSSGCRPGCSRFMVVGRLPGPRLQPRALRRLVPFGPLVRGGLGRFPGVSPGTSRSTGDLSVAAAAWWRAAASRSRSPSATLSTPVRDLRRRSVASRGV